MRHFYMNIVKVCIDQSSAHPAIPSANNKFLKEILWGVYMGGIQTIRSTSKSRIIMIRSCKQLFSQKNLNILAFNFEGFSFLYFYYNRVPHLK